MELKNIRIQKNLTQEEAANLLGVSRRTYIKYENDENYLSKAKFDFACDVLKKYGYVDENHGILTLEYIKDKCSKIFGFYNVEFAYLFGSYAKNKAKETSDVDLLISTPIDGVFFFELVETLREELKKKVDVLDIKQLNNNLVLTKEILKDGIKIYG